MTLVVSVVIAPLEEALSYKVPEPLRERVAIGSHLKVPLGKRHAEGFVVGLTENHENDSFELKEATDLASEDPCFLEDQLPFFQWIADYYVEPLSKVLETAIPASVAKKFIRHVEFLKMPEKPGRGRLKQEILEFLSREGTPVDYSSLLRRFPGAGLTVRKLVEVGGLRVTREELKGAHVSTEEIPGWAKQEVHLMPGQSSSLESILAAWQARRFEPFLLYGITGSGKTEVYIEAIKKVTAAKGGALVIVPEIALTPQLIDRFRARLGDGIAVLHSAVSKRDRWDSWRALLEGRYRIAIGARSAIFAPIRDLQLIVVDEEHDSSFKQAENIRYNARDLAVIRAKHASCPVVLGSATPSLESFLNSHDKRYTLLELPERHAEASLPSVEIVDLNRIKQREMPSRNVSPRFLQLLKQTIEQGSQAFVLYNRRGFASYLQCEKCGGVVECPNCSVTLTYHRQNNSLLCHYCGYSSVPSSLCGQCPERDDSGQRLEPGTLVHRGSGTEKILEEIENLLPGVPVERLDRDAVEDLNHYRSILRRVRSGETRILVGTQMIAKGHDLPDVTLVGIVDCDVGLNFPDFRCAERAFQLLTQASGRAGRGERPGNVVLQTRVPNHPSLHFTKSHDFTGFAAYELKNRKALHYPPFSRLARLLVASQEKDAPPQILLHFKEILSKFRQERQCDLAILGPAPAPLGKVKTLWRWHMLLKSRSASTLNHSVRLLKGAGINKRKHRLIFDLDPQDML